MSVLLEAISVVALRSSIETKYPGGIVAFERNCPNRTFCADEHLVRIGFMAPSDVETFVRALAAVGLVHVHQGRSIDLVVVDQYRGPTTACEWIDGGQHPDGYSTAWLRDTPPGRLEAPKGWSVEQSRQMTFVDLNRASDRVRDIAREGSMDIVLDLETGRELYAGRVHKQSRSDDGAA